MNALKIEEQEKHVWDEVFDHLAKVRSLIIKTVFHVLS